MTHPPDSPLPHDAQWPHPDEELRQKMWEYVYELLPTEEANQWTQRITSDPEIARLYAEVKLQAARVAEALVHQGPQVLFVVPAEESPGTLAGHSARVVTPVAAQPPEGTRTVFQRWVNVAIVAATLLLAVGWALTELGRQWLLEKPGEQRPPLTRVMVPSAVAPDQPLTLILQTLDTSQDDAVPAKIKVSVSADSTQDKPTWEASVDTDKHGLATLVIPKEHVKEAGQIEIYPERWPEAAVRARIGHKQQNVATHVATDRFLYRPGDTVHFRYVVLDPLTLTPGAVRETECHVFHQRTGQRYNVDRLERDEQNGLAYGTWKIPERGQDEDPFIVFDSYTLRIVGSNTALSASKRFYVNLSGVVPWDIDAEFHWDAHNPGDLLHVDINLRERGAASQEMPNSVQLRVTAGDQLLHESDLAVRPGQPRAFQWKLPDPWPDSPLLLHILARHGTSSTCKLLPVRRRGAIPTVVFYPEDGQLIAGLPSRVYFEAHDEWGFPARLHVERYDSQNRVIDSVETYSGFDGWGVCSFTPRMGENYVLRDATTGAQWPLPPVRDGTCVKALMRVEPTVVTNDQPERRVQVKAFANHARTLLAVVSKENVVVEQQPLKESSDGQNVSGQNPWRHEYTADVNLPAQLSGLIRVTLVDVSDETPSPLAERLVFCEPARIAKLVPQQAIEVVAGQPWSFDLEVQLPNAERSRQEIPHGVAAVNIQPQSVSSSWNTSLLADLFLRDGSGLLGDDYLLLPDILGESDSSRRSKMIELLLGTRGWRIRNIPTDDGSLARNDSEDIDAASHGAWHPDDQPLSGEVRERQDFLGRSAAERVSLTVADNKVTLDQRSSIEPHWTKAFTGIVEKFYANRAVAYYVSWLALMVFVILALGLGWTPLKVGVSSLAVALLFLVLAGWQFGLDLPPAANTTVAKATPQSWPGGEVARRAKPVPGGDVSPLSVPAGEFADTHAGVIASRESAPGGAGPGQAMSVEDSMHESLSSRDKQAPQPRESTTNQEKVSQPPDTFSEPSAGIAARQRAAAGAGRNSTEPGRAPAAAVAEGRRSALRGSAPRGIEPPAPQSPAPQSPAPQSPAPQSPAPQPPEGAGQATPLPARKASAAAAVERDLAPPSSAVHQVAPDNRGSDEQQTVRLRQLQVQSRDNLQQYRLMEQIAQLPISVAIQGNSQTNQAFSGVPVQVTLQNDRSAAAPQTHAVVPDALRMAPLKRQSDRQGLEQTPELPLFEESLAAEGLWKPVVIVKGGQVQTAWQVPEVAVPYWAVAVFHGQNAVGESRWTLQPLPKIEVTSKPFDQGLVLTVGDSLDVPLEWINRSREPLRVPAPLGTAPFMQLRLSPALLEVQPQEKQGALLHLQTQFPLQTDQPVFVRLVDESSFAWQFDKFLEDGCWQVNLEWQQEPASVTPFTVWLAPPGYPHTTPPVLIRGEGGVVMLQELARHALWHRVTVRIYPTTAAEVWDTVGWLTKHPPPPALGRLLAERLLRWSEERKIAAPQLKRQVKHWLAPTVTDDYTAYASDVSQWLQVEAAALKLAEGSGTAAFRPRAGSRAEGAVNPPMTTRLKQLALAARIAVLQGAPEAGQLLQRLAEAQSPDGALRERTSQNQSDGRQGSSSDVETTALAVLAWSHAPHAAEYSAHVTRALEWLRQQRAADGSFGSVWASSLAVMALLSESHDAAAHAADTAPRQATLWIDGAELHQIVFQENSILPVVQHVLLPGRKANQIRLRLGDPESETSTARALLAVRSWVEEAPKSASTYQLSVRLEPQEGKVQDRGRLLIELAGSEPKSALLSIGLPAGLEPDLRALPPQVSLVGRRLWLRIEWPFRGPQEWVVSEGCLRFEIPVQLRWAGHFTGPPSFVACDDEPQNSAWAPPLVVDIRP